MNETYYTREQAMGRLRMRSINAFLQLERKFPYVFVNLNGSKTRQKNPCYDKAVVDGFAITREHLKPENP